VQREIVDRLLEVNQERYNAEKAAGLHDTKNKKSPRGKTGSAQARAAVRQLEVHPDQGALDV
jgi:hypothetical protein